MLSHTPSQTLAVHGFLNLSHGICTANPSNIEHLLRTNFSNYIKGSRVHGVLHDLLGDGIFIVDSDLWYTQRKIASFEFNTRSLRNFVDETIQLEILSRLVPFLEKASKTEEIFDLEDLLKRFAFDNICKLAFGDDPDCFNSTSPFVSAFDEAVQICSSRAMSPIQMAWKLKRFLKIGSEKQLKTAINIVNGYASKIIESRKEKNLDDLLSRFMFSDNVHGKNEKFLRDIIISFILAGKDTTSTALTWFFWVLSANLDCQNRIVTELTQLRQVRSGVFNYEDLKNLNYLHAAISESLRLFPPIPINTRLTVRDDILPDGTHVGGGWHADYSAYAVGRMESVWGADCREFRPERWLDKDGVFRPLDQFKFPVFHAGPRICLGKEMAYVQMKSIAASMIWGYEIEAIDGGGSTEKMKNPPYMLSLVLKMKGGLPVRIKKRS